MFRGNWGILAALAGLAALFTAFGAGLYLASLNYPKEERYQSYRYATDKPQEVEPATAAQSNAQPFEDRTPCRNPKGQGESDLCAQWRAANAAEDSALWTKWGVWIAVIGSSLLLWQIILTRQAVEDTSEATEAMRAANDISERSYVAELRPYFNPSDMAYQFLSVKRGPEEPTFHLVCNVILTNSGNTPALNAEVWVAYKSLDNAIDEDFEFAYPSEEPRPLTISPRQNVQSVDIPIPIPDIDDTFAGTKFSYVYGVLKYGSMLDESHNFETKFLWRVLYIRNAIKLGDDGATVQVKWLVEPLYNSVT